ncbi:hypothetical protein KP79_PYT12181 [Mizuhopecten yessoensis]|uniref:C2H2-type domain-containing protein n=1 Tax=Mizuhopecten yessoensis TaxID=6573 RepID=A0A210PPS9_MIZYE|nr:hypothetical protein KP79_PYT12181 [Mizuhopecten yessoensis]
MAYIFTHIYADIAPELREKCFSSFPGTDFGSTSANFTSLLTNICKLTGADFVDGNNPRLQGSWHSIKDTHDLLTSLILQQNILNLLPVKQNSLSTGSFQFERPVCTGTTNDTEREKQRDPPQDAAHTVNDRFNSFVSTPDQFPLPVNDEKLGMVSLSRSEHVHVPKTVCDQPSTHSSTNRTVIDFQDVNFETLQDFDNDHQRDSLEAMHTSNALTTVQIKHEYDDEAYSNSHTSDLEPRTCTSNAMSMPDQESSEQQPLFMMQNEGLSVHMKIEEYEGGDGNSGAEDFLDHSSELPLYTTVSPTVTAISTPFGTSRVKKKLPKNSGSQRTYEGHGDSKLKKMYVKETSENGLSFVCVHCNYSTYCLKNIEDHARRNHSERLFHCSMCSTKFGLKRDLKRHYKVKHYVIIDNNQKPNR